jgi:hypothetical protein
LFRIRGAATTTALPARRAVTSISISREPGAEEPLHLLADGESAAAGDAAGDHSGHDDRADAGKSKLTVVMPITLPSTLLTAPPMPGISVSSTRSLEDVFDACRTEHGGAAGAAGA